MIGTKHSLAEYTDFNEQKVRVLSYGKHEVLEAIDEMIGMMEHIYCNTKTIDGEDNEDELYGMYGGMFTKVVDVMETVKGQIEEKYKVREILGLRAGVYDSKGQLAKPPMYRVRWADETRRATWEPTRLLAYCEAEDKFWDKVLKEFTR